MSKLIFSERAWKDYLEWQAQDIKTLKKINMLIRDIERNNYTGLGKPERLKHKSNDTWSRHIDDCHRIVYEISDIGIEIIQCKGHYDDK